MTRFCLALLLAAALGGATPAFAALKKKPAPPQTIACTVGGCMPVPPGCHVEMGVTPDGSPSGFDVIVCPPRYR